MNADAPHDTCPTPVSPDGEDVPLFDSEIRASLQDVLGRDKVADFDRQALSHCLTMLDDIDRALDDGNHRLISELAHSLKGMAGNMGFKRIMSDAARLDAAARNDAAIADMKAHRHTLGIAISETAATLE